MFFFRHFCYNFSLPQHTASCVALCRTIARADDARWTEGTGTVGRFLIRVAVAVVTKTAKMCITNVFFSYKAVFFKLWRVFSMCEVWVSIYKFQLSQGHEERFVPQRRYGVQATILAGIGALWEMRWSQDTKLDTRTQPVVDGWAHGKIDRVLWQGLLKNPIYTNYLTHPWKSKVEVTSSLLDSL